MLMNGDLDQSSESETAKLDMELLLSKHPTFVESWKTMTQNSPAEDKLTQLARRLRYQIATREPFLPDK